MEHQLLEIFISKTDHLRQCFGVCYGELIQLDQEKYLFYNSLVGTEDIHATNF